MTRSAPSNGPSPSPTPSEDSLPPNDTEAEEQVLGALLVDGRAAGEVAEVLRPQDFFLSAHRAVYEAMLAVHGRDQPTDLSLVRAELEQRGALDAIGGYVALLSWVNATPTAVNVLHYAWVVADRAHRRRLLGAAGRIASLAYDTATADEAQRQALELLALAGGGAARPAALRAWSDLVADAWQAVQDAHDARQRGEVVTQGLPTGLRDLDEYGGLRPGELIVLAARPSMGKSSLAVQIAVRTAAAGKRVLVFSVEMPGRDVAGRALWQRTGLDSADAYQGLLSDADLASLADAAGAAASLPIRLLDAPALALGALTTQARNAARDGVDLIVVDYLQLLKGTPRRDGNRVAEVTEISAALKGLARDLNVPLLALSQLNRQVEHRNDGEPRLADLRESGALEQDADQVWLLWREALDVQVATLKVAKNRNGPVGSFQVRFDTTTTRFADLDTRHASPYP